MMVIMEIKKNTQNNTSFHISSFLKKKKKIALKSETSQMIERKAQSRKIKNEIGEVIERSYDARGDMVEGIKGWNI